LGVLSPFGVGSGSARVSRTSPKATQMPINNNFIEL
jgi:hypothetical protein